MDPCIFCIMQFFLNLKRGDIKQPLCDMTLDLTQSTNHIIMEHSLLSLADFEEVRISFIISILSLNYLVPLYDRGSFYILYGNHSHIIYIQCFIALLYLVMHQQTVFQHLHLIQTI